MSHHHLKIKKFVKENSSDDMVQSWSIIYSVLLIEPVIESIKPLVLDLIRLIGSTTRSTIIKNS